MPKYKVITKENFLLPDLGGHVTLRGDRTRTAVPEDLLEFTAQLKLTNGVPEDVAEMFEVAKGAFIYGSLYRPLLTMGYHYAILAVEAALYAKYQEAGGSDQTATMGNTIKYLEKHKMLPSDPSPLSNFSTGYHLAKQMRDKVFAHPRFTTMFGLAGFNIFELCADLINALYPQIFSA